MLAGDMDEDELAAWLRLVESPGVSRHAARRLLAAFGSPEAVLSASPAARRRVVPEPVAAELDEPASDHAERLSRALAWLAAGARRAVVALGDPRYPQVLLDAADPPLLLYVSGRTELLGARDMLAIVGSRHATPQGLDNARAFASHLSQAGFTIVSGLALGIDGAAHEGALEGVGSTIAVVGTGLDRVYPKRHLRLAHRIAEQGLLVSEYGIGAPALAQHFPRRNRIIAGLTRGTLVVEAALQSGSLITARLAAEAGREVFAIPGSIHAPQARGCHALIKQGAKLVETAADILDELVPARTLPASSAPAGASSSVACVAAPEAGTEGHAPPPPPSAARPDQALLDAMGWDPLTLDALIARTGRPAADLTAHLLQLELEGRVQRLPGALFQRRGRA